MTQSDFFEDAPASDNCGFKASDIGAYFYKIRDDSVRPRHFLGADNKNKIKAIFSDCKGHSLHEIIDRNKPLCSIIDFDLSIEILNAITLKLLYSQVKNLLYHVFRDICLKVFSK